MTIIHCENTHASVFLSSLFLSLLVGVRKQQFLSLKALATYSICYQTYLRADRLKRKKRRVQGVAYIPDPTLQTCLLKRKKKEMAVNTK
jgi:hypothetical protein